MIDLHLISSAGFDSDLSAADLLALAAQLSVKTVALTDRNSVVALDLAIAEARKLDLTLIPGVKIDVEYKRQNAQLLAYFIDHHAKRTGEILEWTARSLESHLERCAEALTDAGVKFDWAAMKKKSANRSLSFASCWQEIISNPTNRDHALLAGYLAGARTWQASADSFYRDHLSDPESKFHVPYHGASIFEIADRVRELSSLSILCRPGEYSINALLDIAANGIEGLEVYCPWQDAETTKKLLGFCIENDLLVTAGSGFPTSPVMQMGLDPREEDVLLKNLLATQPPPYKRTTT